VKAAHGRDAHRLRSRAGEGIVGRVVETGRAIVVPQVSHEPLLAERGGPEGDRELSFICAPLVVNRRTVGALSVYLAYKKQRHYDRSLKFFRVVGSMVAQAVKVTNLAEAEKQRLVDENAHLRDELRDRYAFRTIIGNSAPIKAVYEQVAQVARTSTTVLVRGESGTGKEMIAHAIHYNSPRARKPFVKVSCAALPETLIESELFGYEKGAFTGAHAAKKGRFELADGGTLFLDEIGDLNPRRR
jgi:Nif-specific regulatory protein